MGQSISFGDWVRGRRKRLDLTQADLADKISVSLSMLRKIERDERRPSDQLAGLLAACLEINEAQRPAFLQLARGKFVAEIPDHGQGNTFLTSSLHIFSEQKEEQTPFVARDHQLILLHEFLDTSAHGNGKIVFIAGEAGRGKTSLLSEFARQALASRPDWLVAGGSCDIYTGQGDPLLPFRDIFRWLVGDLENTSMRAILNQSYAVHLANCIPEIIEILLDQGPHLVGTLLPEALLEARLARDSFHHPQTTRLLIRLQSQHERRASSEWQEFRQERLFEEISATLKTIAQHWPILLLLDDLHWVDQSSAALLGHLAMRIKNSPILIVGSYRPEELAQHDSNARQSKPAQQQLQEVLSESLRQFGQNRIDLDHATPAEELGFVNALLDVSSNTFDIDFRKQLTRLTEGHPLFVVELLRDMRERGDIYQASDGRWYGSESVNWKSLPARVEGVIEKRISRLPVDLRSLLSTASVQGEVFFAEIIARVMQSEARDLVGRLSGELDNQHRLIHAQGVLRTASGPLSQYRFRHQMFQRYLYEHLSAAEKMYLHEAVGFALELLMANSSDPGTVPAAQLAHHFQEAGLGFKASQYLLLAGQQAARVLAFDEAAAYLERGVMLLQKLEPTPEIQHLEYELSLALARTLWHSGHVADAMDVWEKCIELARALDDPTALARAALAYEEPRWRLNLDPDLSQQSMREALAALGDEESGLQVRLLVSLARSLLNAGQQEELLGTVDQALIIARRTGDRLALFEALRIKALIDRRPQTTTDRLKAVQELIDLGRSIGDLERLADGYDLYIYDQLELGQIELVDQAIAVQRQVAQELKQPFQMHIAAVFQTMRAIMRGEFILAERLANEAAEISRQIGVAEIDGIFGVHMFTIRREQGRIHEITPIIRIIAANNPQESAWRPGLALIYSILDHQPECRAIFEDLAVGNFEFVPQDSLRVTTLAYLCEVCAYLGDAERAAVLYELLLPYDRRAVVVGGATACFGAVSRYLGMLATTQSKWELAEQHFKAALELDTQMAVWPWLAHSQYEYSAMLLRRGWECDRGRASALLSEAERASRRLGMAGMLVLIAALQNNYDLVSR